MKKNIWRFFRYLFLLGILIITLVPILWVIVSSLKTRKEMITSPLKWPETFMFSNYIRAWEKVDFQVLTKNSVLITASSLVFMIVLAAMMAFAITRYRNKVSRAVMLYMLIGQTISTGMIIFPIVLMLRKMGLGGSHLGLILTYIAGGLPFAVFVMQGFFSGIPGELYEAAEIDGASEFSLFYRIAIPLAKPSLATVLMYQFMWVWNEFVLAFTVINDTAQRTIIVGLYSAVNGALQTDYVTAFAGAAIVSVPIIVIYLVFQRYLIEGLVAGALKG